MAEDGEAEACPHSGRASQLPPNGWGHLGALGDQNNVADTGFRGFSEVPPYYPASVSNISKYKIITDDKD
jgi:hypothetical protein